MSIQQKLEHGIEYLYKELLNLKNDSGQRKSFLLSCFDLYLNGLEKRIKSGGENEFIYLDIDEIKKDADMEKYIGGNVLNEKIKYIFVGLKIPMKKDEHDIIIFRDFMNKIKKKEKGYSTMALFPVTHMEEAVYTQIKVMDERKAVNLFKKSLDYDESVLRSGYEYLKSHKVGYMLLAGGGGTRFKDSVADLRKNPENDQNLWTARTLEKSGVLDLMDPDIAKVAAPMTPIANNSPLQENIESISSILRDFDPEMPVVIIVGPTTEKVVCDLLVANKNFGIKNIAVKSQGKLPFIEECAGKVAKENEAVLDGANGGGGTLLALGDDGLKNEKGEIFYQKSALDWYREFGVDDVILAQTDDAKDREVYIGLASLQQKSLKKGRKSIGLLGGDYPGKYKVVEKNGKKSFDFDFKFGTLWDFLNEKNETVKTEVIEFAELKKDQLDTMISILDQKIDKRLIGNFGSYILPMELIDKVLKNSCLPLHFQVNKTEKLKNGDIIKVCKFEYFMTDMAMVASTMGFDTNILMLRSTEEFSGYMKYMNIDALPLKDVFKLAVAQMGKEYKDRRKAEMHGIYVDEKSVVEFSNLANLAYIGENMRIVDGARVYFGGSADKDVRINVGKNVTVKGDITFCITGEESVNIPDGTVIE